MPDVRVHCRHVVIKIGMINGYLGGRCANRMTKGYVERNGVQEEGSKPVTENDGKCNY